MGILEKFLEDNREDLVEFVQSDQGLISIGNTVYSRLLNELTRIIPLPKDETYLVLDKAHIELSNAIIAAMWCGWLSQAKANRGIYSKNYPDIFKDAICDAFEIGKKHATNKP